MAACALAAACLAPGPAWGLELGGSLGWDLARTESDAEFADTVQESFGQTYRVHLGGGVVNRRLALWNGGVGWRRDLTNFSGVNRGNREVTVTDFDLGLRALPATMPINLNLRRSRQESDGGAGVVTDVLTTTASLTTHVPMPDGNPLGFSAYATEQDPGTGTSKSRLVAVSKRFDLTSSTDLNSSYQFARYIQPAASSTGHAVSLASHTSWNEYLASNVYGNVSSRSSTTTRNAGGRSLFLNNSAGGGLQYRRGREVSGNLTYSFTQSPQDQAEDIRSHLLAGRGTVRVGKKTDVGGRFTARRLDLPTVTLDTATANLSLTHRPRFGWSTGGTLGLAKNRSSGGTSDDRNTYNASTFLNARHEFVPAQVDWGGNLAYSTSSGNLAQDRLTTTVHVGATERRLRTQRISGQYRFTEIHEDRGGGLDPFTRDHGITLTDHFLPVRGLLLPRDVISGSVTGSVHWSQQFRPDRKVRNTNLNANAKYVPLAGLVTTASFELQDNSSDLGGANEILRGTASWTRRAFRRGTARLSGEYRRTWASGTYESSESKVGLDYDHAVGLLHVSFTADATFTELPNGAAGTDTTNVRLNIVRTF
jgi:hypothetical protein